MNKTVVAVVGCLAVLLLVCCVAGVAFFWLGNQSDLLAQFLSQKGLGELGGSLETVATTAAPTKAPVAATQPAQGKTAPTTAAPSGNPFAAAVGKAKAASKFRVEFSWIFGGMDKGKYQETSFIDFKGEVDGKSSHMTSKGGILAMLAKDANSPIEFIEADGKTYMKGVSMFGMTDPKIWYISDDNSATSSFSDFAKPDEFGDWTGGKTTDYKKVRTEQLDGQSCDVYLYDVKTQDNLMVTGLLAASNNKANFSAVDKGEMNFWLCGDGFVHKFLMDYQGHDSKDAAQKAALKMTWHAWDFNNAAISVTVPKDAKPMPK